MSKQISVGHLWLIGLTIAAIVAPKSPFVAAFDASMPFIIIGLLGLAVVAVIGGLLRCFFRTRNPGIGFVLILLIWFIAIVYLP